MIRIEEYNIPDEWMEEWKNNADKVWARDDVMKCTLQHAKKKYSYIKKPEESKLTHTNEQTYDDQMEITI